MEWAATTICALAAHENEFNNEIIIGCDSDLCALIQIYMAKYCIIDNNKLRDKHLKADRPSGNVWMQTEFQHITHTRIPAAVEHRIIIEIYIDSRGYLPHFYPLPSGSCAVTSLEQQNDFINLISDTIYPISLCPTHSLTPSLSSLFVSRIMKIDIIINERTESKLTISNKWLYVFVFFFLPFLRLVP